MYDLSLIHIYLLFLTEAGQMALKKDCDFILRPLYCLRREMGESFESLFEMIGKANQRMDDTEKERL